MAFELLLDSQGVGVDQKGKEGEEPLSYTIVKAHERIVELLLERKEVGVGRTDINRSTLLSYAFEE